MARLTLSPPIPEPLPANLGGTGIANAAASTLTLSSAGTLNLNSGTVAGTSGKTLTFSNSLTLAGTDATTMTFPASSTTIAGLGIAQTFTAANTFSGSANDTTFAVANNTITTGGGSSHSLMTISSTSITGAASLLRIAHTTSSFTTIGAALFLDMASGSGTFSADFIYAANNSALQFEVTSGGTANANAFGGIAGANLRFNTGTLGTGSASAATIGHIPTGQATVAQTGWMVFSLSGTSVRVPYWNNT